MNLEPCEQSTRRQLAHLVRRDRADDLIGQVFEERYRIIELIGEGPLARVYRAERIGLGRSVALKVMNARGPSDALSRVRFEREAMAMATLQHPYCASVLDFGIHDEQPFVVMELVRGQTLQTLLETAVLSIPRAIEIVRQVLAGLSHAHDHGIVHLDINPTNIVVSQKSGIGDHIKILDFGVANIDRNDGPNLDHRADLYACGMLLFELLTGARPFGVTTGDDETRATQHLDAPPRLESVRSDRAFGALEDVVARALAKNRNERFDSAAKFSDALIEASVSLEAHSDATTALDLDELTLAQSSTSILREWSLEQTTTIDSHTTSTPSPIPRSGASLQRRARRIGAFIASATALLVVAAIILVSRIGAEPEQPQPAPFAAVEQPKPIPVAADPVGEVLEKAAALEDAGRPDVAIDFLIAARKTYPKDARLPYQAGKRYFDKMWWADGLEQLRAAIELDARYKTDPDLIKLVIRAFNTTPRYDGRLARFLRNEIGPAARPLLLETAKAHTNPKIRARANTELGRYRG